MTEPIPGQLSLVPELAPDLTGPADRLARPANGASDKTHGPHGQGGALPAPASVGRFGDPGTPAAQAALAYRARLGAWPAAVIRNPTGGHTLAGPLPAEVRP